MPLEMLSEILFRETLCENLEVFGRGELVVCGIAFNDVDAFAEVFEDARLVGGREVQGLGGNAGIELLQQRDGRCLRSLCEPHGVPVDCRFDLAVFCNLDGIYCGLGHKATAFFNKRFADVADNLFADEGAGHVVDQHVFGAAREGVHSVLDGLPAFCATHNDFQLGVGEILLEMILPVGGDGHHDFGDFVHVEEGLQAVAVHGLAAQEHELLGNIAAHALAKSTGGEDCREAPFEGFRSAFRVRIITCHA